jgi:hypothetical protein
MAFQELYPSANIGYISSLPEGLLAEGHRILESQQRALLCASASQATIPAQAPPPVIPPQSFLDPYVIEGFVGPQTNPPLPSIASSPSNPPSRAGSAPPVVISWGVFAILLLCRTFKSSILPFLYLPSWGGGSNSSDYTASEWGGSSADVTSS